MPLSTSLALILPSSLWIFSPATPHQLALIPICMVGWPRMAVVHSTVWIFAKSAALTSRAWSKSASSDQEGYSARRRSQIALCSSMKIVCIRARPIQKPGSWEAFEINSLGGVFSGPTSSLPSTPERTLACVSAVDLGAVPPVALGVEVGRRGGVVGLASRIRWRTQDLHRALLWPGVVLTELQLPRVILLALPVAEPVPDHKLQPRCGKQIERGRGLEFVARQKLAAYRARVWPQERPVVLGVRELQGDVTSEASPRAAHRGVLQVVEGPVRRARGQVAAIFRRGLIHRSRRSVVQVALPQSHAKSHQSKEPQWNREPVPPKSPVERFCHIGEHSREHRSSHP